MKNGSFTEKNVLILSLKINDYFFESLNIFKYNPSTLSLAQGVLRRNFKLDLMDGSWVKHLIVILSPSSSQP